MRFAKSFLVLSAMFLFSSCQEKVESKLYPSDYLFAQRSYPHNDIDTKAFREAIKSKHQYSQNRKSNFEMSWENIGPFNSDGRVTDLELHPQNDNIIYAGSASGGIYKSLNSGDTWTPIFDESPSLAIGDLAIYKKDANIIYAGTGESNAGGGSLAYDGQGVFKTSDSGDTWTNIGLHDVGSIGRVVIDPNDSNTLFVAGMGSLFKNNSDRGVYKSSDSGESWEQVLTVSDSTGAIDLAINPQDGNIVYAAMWERIRRPENRQYGGVTSGIYKSLDGGTTWTEMTIGLPEIDDKGRIGLAISESSPNIVYAYYLQGSGQIEGIFKTEDAGDTWVQKSHEGITGTSFNWWFGKIFVDPSNPDKLIVTSLTMFMSEDGADSWKQIFPGVHPDQHAVAIGRTNPDKIFIGNDGGVYLSEDSTHIDWEYKNGLGNYQFYTCTIDPTDPDVIYGGAQDNGTSRSEGGSPNWEAIFGGDGFKTMVDPTDGNQIYVEYQYGSIFKSSDFGNNFQFATSGLGGDFNWNTPLAMDPNNSDVLYTGSQVLFRSIDKADSWESISPLLVNSDNPQGNLTYGSLTVIEVSSLNSSFIYIGTDDGNVWVTKDTGETYENVSEGLPNRWITSITHDPHDISGVYVTVSGFRFGESHAQIFYSENFGKNWTAIGNTLPDVPVNDLVADFDVRHRLYAATDIGVFYTENQGDDWNVLGMDMPIVPVTDLDYNAGANLLIAASYGRGMFKYNLPMVSSTNNINKLNVNVFPNPFTNKLTIESESEILKIDLFDYTGKILKTFKGSNSLDLEFLESGFYEVVIYSNESKTVKRIVKPWN